MRKTICRDVMTFDELNDSAKEKARDWFRERLFDYDWFDSTYEDAETIGLKITGFDVDRGTITGNLTESVGEVCRRILDNHGASCDTYKLAQQYFKRKSITGGPFTVEEFQRDLLEEYLVMLRHEVEYMQSNEYIDEGILANEYTFTETGKREG